MGAVAKYRGGERVELRRRHPVQHGTIAECRWWNGWRYIVHLDSGRVVQMPEEKLRRVREPVA